MGVNIFLSYLWLSETLAYMGLSSIPIITWNDLAFSYGKVNLTMLGFQLLFIIPGILWGYYLPTVFRRLRNIGIKENRSQITQKIILKVVNLDLKGLALLSLLTNALIILIILLVYQFFHLLSVTPKSVIIFISLGIIPLFFLFAKSKTIATLLFTVSFIIASNKFVKEIIKEAATSKQTVTTELSFIYQGNEVSTSDTIRFCLHTYSYLILQKVSTHEYLLFSTDEIDQLKIHTCYIK